MAERVFLDACVLYPGVVRALLLGAAEAGLIEPFWTARVLREWRIAAARAGTEDEAASAAAAMQKAHPEALVEPPPALEADMALPDPADVHVLAGAVAAKAPTILTFNLRDFPARRLAAHGIAARHPDGLLWELLSRAPETMRPLLDGITASAPDRRAGRKLLRRAGLPRLGKAWEQG